MTNEELLSEIDDILRNIPPRESIFSQTPENFSWLGRVAAILEQWNFVKGGMAKVDVNNIQHSNSFTSDEALRKTLTLLHQAKHDLLMKTSGPLSSVISGGMVFDYYDEIRKIIETANNELFFVDPYLDAEFVSRYLVHIKNGVNVRLLAREKLKTLMPAVSAFKTQTQLAIEVRSATDFHDRYVFVDGRYCYQSGASFKDGARKSPTTITQIIDAYSAMSATYESIWNSGKVET